MEKLTRIGDMPIKVPAMQWDTWGDAQKFEYVRELEDVINHLNKLTDEQKDLIETQAIKIESMSEETIKGVNAND